MEFEIWKDIVGYEGMYQVSNLGRVQSLERTVEHYTYGSYPVKGQVLKIAENSQGYYTCSLFKNRIRKSKDVHRLVAIAFLEHSKERKFVVDHIDGNRLNNKLENLRIVTHRENTSTCFRKNESKFSSKFAGVHWFKQRNKWVSVIQINGKTKRLGYFEDEQKASDAYQNELRKLNN